MCGTATTASASAIRPTGMLIQKTQRHPQASVMRPPTSGPTRIAIGNAAPMIERTRGRSRGGATSPTIVCGMRCRPAEPMPCATRAIGELGDVLREPAEQRRDEEQDQARRGRSARAPTRSASLPSTGSSTVLASVYETMTQLICSTAPSSPAIVASEVATTVWSSAPRNETVSREMIRRRSLQGSSGIRDPPERSGRRRDGVCPGRCITTGNGSVADPDVMSILVIFASKATKAAIGVSVDAPGDRGRAGRRAAARRLRPRRGRRARRCPRRPSAPRRPRAAAAA